MNDQETGSTADQKPASNKEPIESAPQLTRACHSCGKTNCSADWDGISACMDPFAFMASRNPDAEDPMHEW